MPKRASPHPTEAELEILNVLWRRGPSTVREVHDELQVDRSTSLTTTLKLLQVMTQKGLTVRESDAYPHRYSPAVPQERTQAGLVQDLVRRAFGGSVENLVMRAVRESDLSGEELDEIQKLLRAARKEKRRV
ncbi:MAG: BlaI/MecI/CopY family transcriptional regulator [Planctomycetes bacterium]|nr:BlaI/MecI/CopY family transcriptional regulator [Planctomycetota bacterium]